MTGWSYSFVVSLFLLGHVGFGASDTLTRHYADLIDGVIGRKNVDALSRVRGTKVDGLRAAVLIAGYHRLQAKKPAGGLDVLAKVVLESKLRQSWQQQYAVFKKKRSSSELAAPDALTRPFTGIDVARLSEIHALPMVEVARCLADLGKVDQALLVIDGVGRHFKWEGRVVAHEGFGDVMMKMGTFQKAAGRYKEALGLLRHSKPTEGLSPWMKLTERAIQQKLGEAQRLIDLERYGAGYVAYRAAEQLRRGQNLRRVAALRHEALAADYPKTVYGEAGRAYSTLCLLSLARNPEISAAEKKWVASQQSQANRLNGLLARARSNQVPPARLDMFSKKIQRIREDLAAVAKLPTGTAAYTAARTKSNEALAENRLGLYRGEVLLAIADYVLDHQLDFKLASELYQKTWDWSELAPSADAKLADFSVPAKAQGVSKPKASNVKKSTLGKVERIEMPVGSIVNRRTCDWYLNDVRARTVMPLGFLAMYAGKSDLAKNWFLKVRSLDEKNRYHASRGEADDTERLLWAVENGYFFCYPEELKTYSGRIKQATMLAGFYYCTERNGNALKLCDRLQMNAFGKLHPRQRAYSHVLEGSIQLRLRGRQAAFNQFVQAVAHAPKNSYTHNRASLYAANAGYFLGGRQLQTAEKLRQALVKRNNRNDWVFEAKLDHGRRLLVQGNRDAAARAFRSIPHREYRVTGDFYLREFDEKQTKEK